MVIFRSLVIFAVLVVFLSVGTGCSSKEPSNQLTGKADAGPSAAEPGQEQPVTATQEKLPGAQQQQTSTAPPAAMPKTLALTGTIARTGDNIMLMTDLGDYLITGQDLSSMVGKRVNVTGAVEEANGQYTINVISFSEN